MESASALTHLKCPQYRHEFDADRLQIFCQKYRSSLLPRYDLTAAARRLKREQVAGHPHWLWRWAELIPMRGQEFRLMLVEGDTPLLPTASLAGLRWLQAQGWLKLAETIHLFNTGSGLKYL